MAHLDTSLKSFETFLNGADMIYAADLVALNSSGVSGNALFAVQMNTDGTGYINVAVTAEGLAPNQTHLQHVHGPFDGSGNPTDAKTPTIAQDADGDGIVEVLEGLPRYGDILLPLIDENANSPRADANGDLGFVQNYAIEDDSNFFSPVTGNDYTFADLMELTLREYVIHGIDIPNGIGAGTGNEVDGGVNGYIPIVPAAAAEIQSVDLDEALRILGLQSTSASGNIILTPGDDRFNGGVGDDAIRGGAGNDFIAGGADDDRISGGTGNDTLDGGLGDDTLLGNSQNDLLRGRSGNDEGNGGYGNDTIEGGFGDDRFGGNVGQDLMLGGFGNDTLNGGAGSDTLDGGAQRDVLNGGADNDMMTGGNGADTLRGAEGSDTLRGDNGRDVLTGDAGQDYISGGVGNDLITAGATDEDAANAADSGASGALGAADYDNSYAGGAGDDEIIGGAGDDIITGDDDSRVSSATGETFDASADGSDTIFGGGGNDEIHTGSWADGDDGFGNTQTGSADDEAHGGDGDDILRGAGGNDSLFGDAGNDDIGGGGGDDLIVGGDGNDTLNGNDGDDIFGGLGGNDMLTGGAGADEFHFDAGTGSDMITDFVQGEDVISLLDGGAISFANSTTDTTRGDSDLSVSDFDVIAALSAMDGSNDQQVVYSTGSAGNANTGIGAAVEAYVAASNGTDTFLYYDDDWSTSGGRELIATLGGLNTAMTASDFDVY